MERLGAVFHPSLSLSKVTPWTAQGAEHLKHNHDLFPIGSWLENLLFIPGFLQPSYLLAVCVLEEKGEDGRTSYCLV